MITVSLEEATAKQLRWYATTAMGLEVPNLSNTSVLKAKILQADPNLTNISLPDGFADPDASSTAGAAPATLSSDGESSSLPAVPKGPDGLHSRYDPIIVLQIHETQDKTKPSTVPLAVQGVTMHCRRGINLELPYRYFLALEDAKENVARDTSETNKLTGLPVKEYVLVHSYPFTVIKAPPADEVTAWRARTDELFR